MAQKKRTFKKVTEANEKVAASEKRAANKKVTDAKSEFDNKGKPAKGIKTGPDDAAAEKKVNATLKDFDQTKTNENEEIEDIVKDILAGDTKEITDIPMDEKPAKVKAQKEAIPVKEAADIFDNEDLLDTEIGTGDETLDDYSDPLTDDFSDVDSDLGDIDADLEEDLQIAADPESNSITISSDDEDFNVDTELSGTVEGGEGEMEGDEGLEDEQPIEEPAEGEEVFGGEEEAPAEDDLDLDMGEGDFEEDGIKKLETEALERKDEFLKVLESVDKEVFNDELKSMLAVQFDMATEAKAKVIAAKKISESIDSISEYVDKTVAKFEKENKAQLTKAITEAKKIAVYNKMKSLVESTFGIDNVEQYNALVVKYNALKKAAVANGEKANKIVAELKRVNANLKSNLMFEKKMVGLDAKNVAMVTKIVESMEFKDHADFEKKVDAVVKLVTEKKATAPKIDAVKKEEKQPITETKKAVKVEEKPADKIRQAIKDKKIEKTQINENKDDVIDPDTVGFNIWNVK